MNAKNEIKELNKKIAENFTHKWTGKVDGHGWTIPLKKNEIEGDYSDDVIKKRIASYNGHLSKSQQDAIFQASGTDGSYMGHKVTHNDEIGRYDTSEEKTKVNDLEEDISDKGNSVYRKKVYAKSSHLSERMLKIKDLIDNIEIGNADAINASFSTVMAEKVSARLDSLKQEVANVVFKDKIENNLENN